MTVTIPFKLIAFLIYTSALLGGAFGISVVVSDWRDDDAVITTTQTTTGIPIAQVQTIAKEEADRAFGDAIQATLCILQFIDQGLTSSQIEAGVTGCIEKYDRSR